MSKYIQNKNNLIQYFVEGIKKNDQLRIGVEHEKFLFNKKDLKRIDYDQIKKAFEILKDQGWKLEFEKEMKSRIRGVRFRFIG